MYAERQIRWSIDRPELIELRDLPESDTAEWSLDGDTIIASVKAEHHDRVVPLADELDRQVKASVQMTGLLNRVAIRLTGPDFVDIDAEGRKCFVGIVKSATIRVIPGTVTGSIRRAGEPDPRIAEREREAELSKAAAKHAESSIHLRIALESYAEALVNREKALWRLYDAYESVRVAAKGFFNLTGEVGQQKLKDFSTLANDKTLSTSRHRGKSKIPHREVTEAELASARETVRSCILAYVNALEAEEGSTA